MEYKSKLVAIDAPGTTSKGTERSSSTDAIDFQPFGKTSNGLMMILRHSSRRMYALADITLMNAGGLRDFSRKSMLGCILLIS